MEVPFVVGGGEVEPPYFIDRERELQDLVLKLGTLSEHQVVLGIRRVGKTCLLHNTLAAIRDKYPGVLTGKVNCRGIGSFRSLADEIVVATLRAYQDEALIAGWVRLRAHLAAKKVMQALEAVDAVEIAAVKDMFRARVEFHEQSLSEEQYLRRAFRFLGAFTQPKRRLVLVLDEFQELAAIPGDVFQLFKSASDELPHIRFAFSGSSLGLLERVFLKPNSPLYMMAGRLMLGPLPQVAVQSFVASRLKKAGIHADAATCAAIFECTGGIPYYVQKMGLLLWVEAMRRERTEIGAKDVEHAFSGLLKECGAEFETRLDKYGPQQKDILRALAAGNARRKDIAEAIRRPEGQLSTALRSLEAGQEVIKTGWGQYQLADVVFRAWLQRL